MRSKGCVCGALIVVGQQSLGPTRMPRIHQNRTWQLEVPDGWEVEGRNELVSLFKPDGVGMLRALTTEEKAPAQSFDGELFRGRMPGNVRTTTDTSTFRKTWWLSCHGERLFVTYQCAAKNAQIELAEVDEILQSMSEAGHENLAAEH